MVWRCNLAVITNASRRPDFIVVTATDPETGGGGDLFIGVADDGSIVGLEKDKLNDNDKFMRYLAQVVRDGLGPRAGTCIDPRVQIVDGKDVCMVSCRRSPDPVFLAWKGTEAVEGGDFFVRNGPTTVKLSLADTQKYLRNQFPETG